MIKCEKLGSDGHCHCRISCQRIEDYQKGKSDAEEEHKAMCDSCIHKVSKEYIDAIRGDARAKTINEIFDKAYDVDMDSICINIRFDKDDFDVPYMPRKWQLKEWLKEQLKEQKND